MSIRNFGLWPIPLLARTKLIVKWSNQKEKLVSASGFKGHAVSA